MGDVALCSWRQNVLVQTLGSEHEERLRKSHLLDLWQFAVWL